MDTSKEKIPKKYRIGDTCFMSLANIGENLYTRHTKNINHVHKEVNNLLSVILILVTDVHCGETFFFNGMTMNDIGKRAHVLKHSHGRCVVVAFDKNLMKDLFGMDPEQFFILSYTNQYLFTLYIMVQKFMTNI